MPHQPPSLDPASVLALVERLRDTLGGLAEREEQAAASLRAQASRLNRDHEALNEQGRTALAEQVHGLETAHAAAVDRHRHRHEQRLARIQQAYHSSLRTLGARALQRKDLIIGRTQSEILRTKQHRQHEYSRAKAKRTAFEEALGGDRTELSRLEQQSTATLRGLRPFFTEWLAGHGIRPRINADPTRHAADLRTELRAWLETAGRHLATVRGNPLATAFRFAPVWIAAPALALVALATTSTGGTWKWFAAAAAAVVAAWLLAALASALTVRRLAVALEASRRLAKAAAQSADTHVAELAREVDQLTQRQSGSLSASFRTSDAEAQQLIREGRHKLEQQHARLPDRAAALHQAALARLGLRHAAALAAARHQADAAAQARARELEAALAAADARHAAAIEDLAAEWRDRAVPLYQEAAALAAAAAARFPAWSAETCDRWRPPAEAAAAVPFGSLAVSLETLAGKLPRDPRMALPGPADLTLPAAIGLPDHASLMIEGPGAAALINNLVLRLLASLPPGRVAFTVIDPVGLGRDFAGLMHLADYEETLINSRIWTQSTQIEERLAELNEHLEKVIQMYLRNEFATIADYNEQAGTIAERYRFVVIAGFPAGFSELAAKRLLSIAASGARCGVFLLVQRDPARPGPDSALDQELARACLHLSHAATPPHAARLPAPARSSSFLLPAFPAGANVLIPELPPEDELATSFIHRLGRASIDSNRVEVPFTQVAPAGEQVWTADTTDELRVPIGRTGAKKLQQLAIGKGTRQHVLVAGKTGSGKSTLFHVIITNLALWCSPEQVEFYLVDFKKGVEFKCYGARRLPHARVVAIESDREFGLSVLERVDAELKRRGELFRALGAQDLGGYKRAGGTEPMPRTLLLIDEFQEFFTEDDPVAQDASLLLDRIVRQGRAFGIHVILGSQTLGGAYTLARTTLGQMVIRIALQCNEADAFLIMDEDNPAPRLLTRPGEGIYNDNAGALEANSPFQTVWLDEDERDQWLARVAAIAAEHGHHGEPPVVFEGNAPADVRDNPELAAALAKAPKKRPAIPRAWLGAPNSIKGPTHAAFRRQSGSNLLVVGQGEERSRVLLAIALLSLSAHYPPGGARFVLLDPAPPDAQGFLDRVTRAARHPVTVAAPHQLEETMADLAAELEARSGGGPGERPDVFVVVRELERFRKLRQEDDFKFSLDDEAGGPAPSKVFQDLITEGPANGIHLLVTIDTWNNVSRWIQRRALGDFEMRVLFQMSANDSANLIDSAAASTLGLHRALLHNDALGTTETFRPYAEPDSAWLDEAAPRPAAK